MLLKLYTTFHYAWPCDGGLDDNDNGDDDNDEDDYDNDDDADDDADKTALTTLAKKPMVRIHIKICFRNIRSSDVNEDDDNNRCFYNTEILRTTSLCNNSEESASLFSCHS